MRHLTPRLAALSLSLLAATSSARADDPVAAVEVDTSGELLHGLTAAHVAPGLDPKATLKVVHTVTWTSRLGPHMAVFLTATKEGRARDALHVSRALHVTTLRFYADDWQKTADVRERVPPCALDLVAEFIDGSIGVTDLDHDGEAELTFAYRFGCGGDVSPNAMKLIMLEGRDKHALRGQSRVDPGAGGRIGGEHKADFRKAPAAFLAHARQVWETHVDER